MVNIKSVRITKPWKNISISGDTFMYFAGDLTFIGEGAETFKFLIQSEISLDKFIELPFPQIERTPLQKYLIEVEPGSLITVSFDFDNPKRTMEVDFLNQSFDGAYIFSIPRILVETNFTAAT